MDGTRSISPDEVIQDLTKRVLVLTCGTTSGGSTMKALMCAEDEICRLRRVINKSVERRTAILMQVERLNRALVRHPDWLAEIRLELEYGPPNASP